MRNFKEGDIVVLKSGGPNMTVSGFKGTYVMCTWFISGKAEVMQFASDALEIYQKPASDFGFAAI